MQAFSTDRNHLFKVAHAIITVCNQQGPAGPRGLLLVGSPRHTGPTWCPAVCAIAGRTRPLVTDFPPQLGQEQTSPGRGRLRPGRGHRKEAVSGGTRLRARAGAGSGARVYKPRALQARPRRERLSWGGAGRRGRRRRGPGREREETGGGDASAGWHPPTLAAPLAPAGLRRRARAAAAAAASAACGGEAGLLLGVGRRLARESGQGRAGQGGRRRRSEVKGGSAPPGGGLALPGGAPCFAPGQPLQRHLQKWPRPMPRRPEGCGKRGGRRPRGAEWLGDLGSALACMEPVMPLLWGCS